MRTLFAAGFGAALATLVLAGAAFAKSSVHPEASVAVAAAPSAVEYKFFLPSNGAVFTAEHERQLDDLGAQGWRVVSPIYSGGILNSYLMMREKR